MRPDDLSPAERLATHELVMSGISERSKWVKVQMNRRFRAVMFCQGLIALALVGYAIWPGSAFIVAGAVAVLPLLVAGVWWGWYGRPERLYRTWNEDHPAAGQYLARLDADAS